MVGYVAELIELPGLLGMMAAGLILRNVPYIDVAKDFDLSVSSPLRYVLVFTLSFTLKKCLKYKKLLK